MADNITLDAGAGGDTIATEDIAGVEFQKIKLVDGTAASTTLIQSGGGTEANALRVTVANDSTGVLTVDNAGTFAVQADLGANNDVTIDGSTVVKAAQGAQGATDTGITAMVVRNDVLADKAGVDGDYTPLQVNASGALYVDGSDATQPVSVASLPLPSGAATSAAQLADGHNVTVDNASLAVTIDTSSVVSVDDTTTHATGTTEGINLMAVATPNDIAVGINDIGMLAMSLDRRLHVDADITASVALDVSAATVTVDGSAVTQPVSAASLPLPTGAATSAAQLADGHNVTVDNVGGVEVVQVTAADLNMTEASAAGILTDTGTIAGDTTSIDGKITACNTGAVVISSGTVTAVTDITNTVTVDNGGTFATQAAATLQTGSALVGDVGLSGARTSGGVASISHFLDVDETEDEVKGSAGQLYYLHAMNLSASVLFLKLYNNTAAGVIVGTTVPDHTFPLPTQGDTNGAGFVFTVPNGISMGTGITIACTTGFADNDSGAPGTNACIVNVGFA